jgi:hypothetical protein
VLEIDDLRHRLVKILPSNRTRAKQASRQADRWMRQHKIRKEVDLSGGHRPTGSVRSGQPKKSREGASLHHCHRCMLCKLSTVGGRGGGWSSSAYGEAEAPWERNEV